MVSDAVELVTSVRQAAAACNAMSPWSGDGHRLPDPGAVMDDSAAHKTRQDQKFRSLAAGDGA